MILLAAYASVRVGVQEGDPRPVGSLAEIEALSERDDVNVLFVLIDTLRAHRLGSYGYERKILESLTLQCKDFGAIAALKGLEDVYNTEAELKRRLRARGRGCEVDP